MNDEQFNPAYRLAVSYIDKSRHFYAAQGYEVPYRWAVNDHVPFQKLTKPLSECNVGLVTTASLPNPDISLDFDPGIYKSDLLITFRQHLLLLHFIQWTDHGIKKQRTLMIWVHFSH